MRFSIELRRYEAIPKWYGVSWAEESRLVLICHPFPLNIVINFCRNVWLKVRYYFSHSETEKIFNKGYELGRNHGLEICRLQTSEEIRKEIYNEVIGKVISSIAQEKEILNSPIESKER